jgi:phospholipid/cholesterol/gamma-HCH transport system substrate-binding protein
VFLLVMAVLAWFAIQVYQQKFSDDVLVTLKADRVGNQLNKSSEVKARGVVVGTVRAVHGGQNGATIDLAMKPDMLSRIPQDVTALLIPKTLFGERYVQLSIPARSTKDPLRAGNVIRQDRSKNAIELEKVFDDLLPVLKAVQPQKLATTLTAISTALDGRGERIGQAMVSTAAYLEEFNPNLPTLTDDLRDLARVSRLYGDIAPDLLDALTDSSVTLNTVADQRVQLTDLYAQVTRSAQDVTIFLRNNKDNLISLAATSRAPLELAAKYSPSFPCTLKALADLKPSVDAMLGAGKDDAGNDRPPGISVDLQFTDSRGKYRPGVDDPVYDATGGPRCYPSGVAPTQGVVAAQTGGEGHPLLGGGDLGIANSPQEQELVATLLAPSVGEVPAWSTVLVGPLYRGTEVTLR